MSDTISICREVSEPTINWSHKDGPLLICDDGTLRWLSVLDRIAFMWHETIGDGGFTYLNNKYRGGYRVH
jgi:hypothetical protein